MAQSSIEWTEMTWNPTSGCTKLSAGCKFCYAEVMAKRLKAMGIDKYKNGFKLAIHENDLNIPYSWKSPKIVFVNSMSDLFHEGVPLEFIKKDGRLYRHRKGTNDIELKPESETKFFYSDGTDRQIEFEVDNTGKVIKAWFINTGQKGELKKEE